VFVCFKFFFFLFLFVFFFSIVFLFSFFCILANWCAAFLLFFSYCSFCVICNRARIKWSKRAKLSTCLLVERKAYCVAIGAAARGTCLSIRILSESLVYWCVCFALGGCSVRYDLCLDGCLSMCYGAELAGCLTESVLELFVSFLQACRVSSSVRFAFVGGAGDSLYIRVGSQIPACVLVSIFIVCCSCDIFYER